MKEFRLDGATVVVTGAGTGIGRATAVHCAIAGAKRIVLVGRRPEMLAETGAEIKKAAPSCEPVPVTCDVAKAADRDALVKKLATTGVDGLVNNAGIFSGGSLAHTTDEDWAANLEVNLTAPFALTRGLLPLLVKSRNAAVVNVSSTLAVKPIPDTAAYNASKAGLIQLSRTLALELGPKKIRVNCVLPAVVDTPMYRGRYSDDASYKAGVTEIGKFHPIGRIGEPSDVARAILFLLSPAASWITGVSLPVDGGMLCT